MFASSLSLSPAMDDFDPNTFESRECFLFFGNREPYSDSCFRYAAKVDPEFYPHLVRWRWSVTFSRNKVNTYFRRTVTEHRGYTFDERGRRIQDRVGRHLFLHVYILEVLMGQKRPSKNHVGGHLDDDTFNNTRANLAWITSGQNNKGAAATRRRNKRGNIGTFI